MAYDDDLSEMANLVLSRFHELGGRQSYLVQVYERTGERCSNEPWLTDLIPLIDSLNPEDREIIQGYLCRFDEFDEDIPLEEIESSWLEEIQRRVALIESGEAELIPAEQVFAELREMYPNDFKRKS